jgi:hypothetical protein
MKSNTYYKLYAYVTVLVCIGVYFFIQQYSPEQDNGSNIVNAMEVEEMTIEEEIIFYEEILNEAVNSNNPSITSEFKDVCKGEIKMLQTLIDDLQKDKNISESEEAEIRRILRRSTKGLVNHPAMVEKEQL